MAGKKIDLPIMTKGDAAHAITKAGLSAIPFVGGPAVELFQYLVQPPLERRRNDWMADVGTKLQELEDAGIDIEQLGQSEEFVTAVLSATQIALRTHYEEKREAPQNALVNIAIGQSPGEALQHMFFNWIDSMSPLHMQIVKVFQKPAPQPGVSMGGLEGVLVFNLPHLRGHTAVYRQIWKDLYSRGLLNTEGLNTTMSESGLKEKRTTEIGDAFLRFISEPLI